MDLSASDAAQVRLALLHKGADVFLMFRTCITSFQCEPLKLHRIVDRAVEAVVERMAGQRERERRALKDLTRKLARLGAKVSSRHCLADQPHREAFAGCVMASGE